MSRLLNRLQALRRDVSGIAMTEFALALPIFLAMGLTGVEVAHYTMANLRVSQIALMVADNAGRVRTSIDERDIDEVMIGARLAGQGIELGQNGRIILSSLEPNGLTGANEGQMIRWQRCFGLKPVVSSYGVEGAGTANATLVNGIGPNGRKIKAMAGGAVMFVEMVYDYEPVFIKGIFTSNRTLRYTAAYTVRERASHTMNNASAMTDAQKRLCANFTTT